MTSGPHAKLGPASGRLTRKLLRLAEIGSARFPLARRLGLAMEDGFAPRARHREQVCLLVGPAPLVGPPNSNRPVVTR
jgi:hypothetical protein